MSFPRAEIARAAPPRAFDLSNLSSSRSRFIHAASQFICRILRNALETVARREHGKYLRIPRGAMASRVSPGIYCRLSPIFLEIPAMMPFIHPLDPPIERAPALNNRSARLSRYYITLINASLRPVITRPCAGRPTNGVSSETIIMLRE